MNIQWGELVEENIGHERELPPLTGLDKFVEVAMVQDASQAAVNEPANTTSAADEIVIDFQSDADSNSNLTTPTQQAPDDEAHAAVTSAEAGVSPLRRNMSMVIAIGVIVILGGGAVMVMRPS